MAQAGGRIASVGIGLHLHQVWTSRFCAADFRTQHLLWPLFDGLPARSHIIGTRLNKLDPLRTDGREAQTPLAAIFEPHDAAGGNRPLYLDVPASADASFIVHQRLSEVEKVCMKRAYLDGNLIVWPELVDRSTDEVVLIPCGAEDLGN